MLSNERVDLGPRFCVGLTLQPVLLFGNGRFYFLHNPIYIGIGCVLSKETRELLEPLLEHHAGPFHRVVEAHAHTLVHQEGEVDLWHNRGIDEPKRQRRASPFEKR